MAKERSDKSRYQSRYAPRGWVHAAQYIAELICEKKAQNDRADLPLRFWELPDWKKYFQFQVVLANRLIKEHGEHAVIAALRDNRTYKTYSLRSGWLHKVIEEYVLKEEISRQIAEEVLYDFREKKTFDSNNSKKSVISELKDLE
jgi:hypothetical protein